MPQYMDVGIYLQSLMLLAREEGLHTAAQGWWRQWPKLLSEHLNIDADDEVLVGLSLGYGNDAAAVNDLRADRAPLEALATFYD